MERPPPDLGRTDWRFLLQGPDLGRVAYLGRNDPALIASLRPVCDSLSVVEGGGEAEDPTFDVVVAHRPDPSEVRRAAGLVRPGGALVVEGSGREAAATRRSLVALGYPDPRSYWHWPRFAGCTRIVPLYDASAVRHGLARAGRGVRGRARAWLGRRLQDLGLLHRAARDVSILAARPQRDPAPVGVRHVRSAPLTAVHGFVERSAGALGLDSSAAGRMPFVLLTPGFETSAHLIYLLLGKGGDPALVVKLSRRSGPSARLEREAAVLRALQGSRSGGFGSIPRVLARESCNGHALLLETALRGSPMDRSVARRRTAHCCEAMLEWLLEVHATRLPAGEPHPAGARTDRDLEILRRHLGNDPAIAGAREWLAPLATADLPRVVEHRDLSHPNLLLTGEGKAAVVDWELAEAPGFPACDLFFFLAYVAMARRGAKREREILDAIDDAFLPPGGWARPYVGRYARALELSPDLLPALFVAAWTGQVAAYAQRLADGRDGPVEVAERVVRDWRTAAWRHAVARAGRLGWKSEGAAA